MPPAPLIAALLARQQLIGVGIAALALALIAAILVGIRQRALRKAFARQAAELAGQRSLLQALYDHLPIGLTVIEQAPAGSRLISINKEAALLYEIDPGQVGRRLEEIQMAPHVREHFADVILRQARGAPIQHYEYEIEKGRRVLDMTLAPVSPLDGGSPCLCILAEDISEKKRLDAEIAQSRKLRAVGELVGGIAHEFNNLLTPMMLKVGQIQMDRSGDERLQEEVAVIAQAAQSAAELTKRLLTFGRKPEAGAEAVRLAEVVEGCFDLLRPAVDRRIVWDSEVPADLPPLSFSSSELNQIIINLLLNARDTLVEKLALPHDDAWSPHVQVSVTALPPGAFPPPKPRPDTAFLGWQRLTVADNGLGMPPNVVERIFEPFFTTKEVGKGTGLGLATVWHLVTEAGGRVEAESQPGAGSSFHVWLPVWQTEPPEEGPIFAQTRPGPASARVLVVEDEPLVAKTVTALIGRRGHHVDQVADGAEAWRHLQADIGLYALLVVDVNLPGLNGIDLVGRAREAGYTGHIIVMSGRLAIGQLRALVKMNVNRVLTKPFTVDQFESAICENLES